MFLRLSITHKSALSISLLSCFTLPSLLYAEVIHDETTAQKTTSEDFVETLPIKARYIVNQLKNAGVAQKTGKQVPSVVLANRLLLHGPTGNGKTKIAQKIAEQAGAHCIYKVPFGLTSGDEKETAANIRETFYIAHEHVNKKGQPVVIIFDDINSEKTESLGASQELQHQLALIQNDARFLFISIAYEEKIHPSFKAHFDNNIEKINSPNEKVRRDVLQLYKKKLTGTPWNEKFLKKLVDNSDNEKISIRFLEDYVREVYLVAENDNDGVITDELAWDIFEEMKSKYVESFTKRIKRQITSILH